MADIDENIEPMQVDVLEADPPEPSPDNTQDREFTVDDFKIDLEAYAQSYKGLMKLQRLHFIGKHCPSIAIEALKLCISELKKSYNIDMYKMVMNDLADAIAKQGGDDSAAQGQQQTDVDDKWVERRTNKAVHKREKLDQDLKTYKINSIKESIRRGHDDCANHFVDMGDLINALRCFSRTRDYCVSAQHIVQMCVNVITCSIYMRNWTHVTTYVNKAENVHDIFDHAPNIFGTNTNRGEKKTDSKVETFTDKQKKENNEAIARVKCASGLVELNSKRYKEAAKTFLQISHEHFHYPEILSAVDVAQYGGICALATFNREELQKYVLTNNTFKQFLEHLPPLREILHKFYSSKYAKCLELLDQLKCNLELDIFLSPHVEKLYAQIRNKALVQYFSPYTSANLNSMAAAFNTTIAQLEEELTQLILDGQISARIDSSNKILHARNTDIQTATYRKALDLGREFEQKMEALILRSVVLKNNVQVKSPYGSGVSMHEEDVMLMHHFPERLGRMEMMRGKRM